MEMLADLTENWSELFVGRTGGISFGDWPPKTEWVNQFPFSFCTTKQLGIPSPCLPFPCPYSLRWPAVGIPDAEAMLEEMLADDSAIEDERVFWIGAETHPSRRLLHRLGRENPSNFDVELMEWDRKAPGGQRSKTRQVSLPDHRKFKYLIDCPGYGYSARLKWLLAAGRPVFVVERDNVEHWHEEMEPWVHFVPVKADLSDLLAHHDRLERNPSLYEEIAFNGRSFAAENLRVADQLARTAEAVARSDEPRPAVTRHPPSPGKRAAMVVARHREDLAWIAHAPEWMDVFVINKGGELPEGHFGDRSPEIERRSNLGRETDSYAAFIESGAHRGYEWVVFSQGDPFTHSPDFFQLLEEIDHWQDVQPLTCQWKTVKNLPPSQLVEVDREWWLQGLRVRKELFSLHTFEMIRFSDPGVSKILKSYRNFHRLPNGTNLVEHFFRLVGLESHADEARMADLGTFGFGAIFGVRSELIDRIPGESMRSIRRLCQRDDLHAYVMERLWLHLFGEPFLHQKSPEAAAACSSMTFSDDRPGWNHRTGVLNALAEMGGARSYLEIGTGDGRNFDTIHCVRKVGVDPEAPADAHAAPTHPVSSDVFFAANPEDFDLILIDGLHHSDQVLRDLRNSLQTLAPGGAVVCHDLNPTSEVMQRVPRVQREWTGDGWKAWVKLRRERPDLCMFVVDADYGLGIILDGGPPSGNESLPEEHELQWPAFSVHRRNWLGLVSPAEGRKLAELHYARRRENFAEGLAEESPLCAPV